MFAITDSACVSVLVCFFWTPIFFVIFTSSVDPIASALFCIYALISLRLIFSDCIFIKSLGYFFATAPFLLFLDFDGDYVAVGG